MKKLNGIIYGRTLIVVLAFLIQFGLLAAIIVFLKEYSLIFYTVFILLGGAVVVHLLQEKKLRNSSWYG